MNEKEMEQMFDLLAEYRKGEIKRTGEFKDRYSGTNVEYYIGDYTISCYFFNMGKEWDPLEGRYNGECVWELCITPKLNCNYGVRLSDSTKFRDSSLYNVITDHIDKLIETFKAMGPYVEQLKKKFAQTLAKVQK